MTRRRSPSQELAEAMRAALESSAAVMAAGLAEVGRALGSVTGVRDGRGDPTGDPPGFTCPRCGRTSFHPDDLAEGYCGACHDWTAAPGGREGTTLTPSRRGQSRA
jgi:hypothetical protein